MIQKIAIKKTYGSIQFLNDHQSRNKYTIMFNSNKSSVKKALNLS